MHNSVVRWFGMATFITVLLIVLLLLKNTFSSKSSLPTNQSATVVLALSSSTNVALDPTVQVSRLPPEAPDNYTDNQDGTISDNITGLIWEKCPEGYSSTDCSVGSITFREWSKARTECENLTLAGKTGWRIPTLKELESIIDTSNRNPAINDSFFGGTNNPYWTLTSPAQSPTTKFIVLFSNGSVYFQDINNVAATRCVYDGQTN